jgi:hypothetical protein
LPNASLDNFTADPIEHFMYANDIYVLTHKPGRVYLESGENSRTFDNVWFKNGFYVFRGQCLALLLFLLLTFLQTSVEGFKVREESESPFRAGPASIVARSLSLRFGYVYRTGEW